MNTFEQLPRAVEPWWNTPELEAKVSAWKQHIDDTVDLPALALIETSLTITSRGAAAEILNERYQEVVDYLKAKRKKLESERK